MKDLNRFLKQAKKQKQKFYEALKLEEKRVEREKLWACLIQYAMALTGVIILVLLTT